MVDIQPGNIYKLPDNSVRVKVIFDSCSQGWAAVALVTRSSSKDYRKGQYLSGFNMEHFIAVTTRSKKK